MARLSDTSNTVIHLIVLIMNLKKGLRNFFEFIFYLLGYFSSDGFVFKLAVEQ